MTTLEDPPKNPPKQAPPKEQPPKKAPPRIEPTRPPKRKSADALARVSTLVDEAVNTAVAWLRENSKQAIYPLVIAVPAGGVAVFAWGWLS